MYEMRQNIKDIDFGLKNLRMEVQKDFMASSAENGFVSSSRNGKINSNHQVNIQTSEFQMTLDRLDRQIRKINQDQEVSG